MKNLNYKSLKKLATSKFIKNLNSKDLIISDIDGVFFKGIFDPRELLGTIDPGTLQAFEKILKTKARYWILTNRMKLFKRFPYIGQISRSIKKITSISPNLYSDCSQFLEDDPQDYSIILNAKKPSEDSVKVVEEGIKNFEKVVYIGSQDLPFYHNDIKLIQEISDELDTSRLTYIEISSWKK
jgi:hypothetical protein